MPFDTITPDWLTRQDPDAARRAASAEADRLAALFDRAEGDAGEHPSLWLGWEERMAALRAEIVATVGEPR